MNLLLLRPNDRLLGRDGRRFVADEALLEATNAALLLGIPLLLTGDPGCGKTDFAFAVARWHAQKMHHITPEAWQRHDPETGLLQCYVRSETRERDLLYRVDTIGRFTDGQLGGEKREKANEIGHYVDLMPLGVAIDSAVRRVVLIDEIDKAPRDLPNDLLRPLEQGAFDIHEIPVDKPSAGRERTVGDATRSTSLRPLVIITSNRERELPEPFLRRCAFHHIPFPSAERLIEIIMGWYGSDVEDHQRTTRRPLAAEQARSLVDTFVALRERTSPELTKKPATAELIQWIRFVLDGIGEAARQRLFDRQFVPRADQQSDDDAVRWTSLPGLSLLVKHTEDFEGLSPRG